jgi:sulfate adenylyltransferase large subunit
VLPQSRRHAYIAALLGIPKLVVAVNKMDAIGYDEAIFRSIENEFANFLSRLNRVGAYFLPISALVGDNVVARSTAMPWFHGPSLLEHLETVDVDSETEGQPFRFPVQYVIRPNQDFRGYAGQIASGAIHPGDEILVLPSGRRTRVRSLAGFDGDLRRAYAPMSATVTLEDNLDISRGDMLVAPQAPPAVSRQFRAHVVWMNEAALDLRRPLLLKHTTQATPAEVTAIEHRINIRTLEEEPAGTLELNDIGVLRISAARPLYFDPYRRNRATGSFSLIDASTNATVGAGMIIADIAEDRRQVERRKHALEPVTPAERMALWRHAGAVVSYGNGPAVGIALERLLFERGAAVIRPPEKVDKEALAALVNAGLLVLVPGPVPMALPAGDDDAAAVIAAQLSEAGVLLGNESLTFGEGI